MSYGISSIAVLFRIVPVAMLCLATWAQDNPQKPLHFKNDTYDFGSVMAGKWIEYTFQCKNASNKEVIIESVEPSCGCAVSEKWDSSVQPGASGVIPVRLDTERFNGPLRKYVKVKVSKPESKEYILWLEGRIWKPVEFSPAHASLGQMTDPDKTYSTTIMALSRLRGPLDIKQVVSDNPLFKVSLTTVEKGREFSLKISANVPVQTGAHAGKIWLEVDHPDLKRIPLSVSAFVPPAIMISPPRVQLPKGPLKSITVLNVHITSHRAGKLVISELKAVVPEATVRLKELEAGKRYRIEVELPKGYTAPTTALAAITFTTNVEGHEKIEIPIEVSS